MIKYISLFSGIGGFEKALNNILIDYDLINFCECNKYAVKSYCAIHNVDASKNLGDITKVDESTLPTDIDLITYGFPCVDISLDGKQAGLFNADGSTTRSGLFFDALRIIKRCRPKVAIAENVKHLVSKKFKNQFKLILESLERAGYNNHWKILNSRDFGIPQNRERVFIVSIRKDIDTGKFKFPEPQELKLRLKDMPEETVDEKYNINLENTCVSINSEKKDTKSDTSIIVLGNYSPSNHNASRIVDINGIAPTVKENHGTVTAVYINKSKIRKLIPKEFFRLMGFDDTDFEKAAKFNSNTQLYKQAGNSVVVNVLEELFCMLFDDADLYI